MNAGALVYCLLDAEGDYTPEGYKLLDTAVVGDYELRLWQGTGHVNKEPVKFNEVSLNAKGRSFDPESQARHFKPISVTHALGRRWDLLRVVANWIQRFGDLYIGSYQPGKLAVYYKLFRRYLPNFSISEPYAPFDECEGKPEYFHVTADRGVVEALVEELDRVDAQRYVDDLPDVFSRAVDEAKRVYAAQVESGAVNEDNFGEMAEEVTTQVVNNFRLNTGDELVDIRTFNTVLHHVLKHADRLWPRPEE